MIKFKEEKTVVPPDSSVLPPYPVPRVPEFIDFIVVWRI
jgi:hypothetical protein